MFLLDFQHDDFRRAAEAERKNAASQPAGDEAVSYTHLSSLTFYLVLGALLVGFIVLGMLKGMIKMLLFLSLIHI